MESLFSMIEGTKSSEITSIEQINQETKQDFLSKLAIWDFYEMTKEEYTSKSDNDKKLIIIKYYNSLLPGIFLLFVVCILLFGFKFWFYVWNIFFCSLRFLFDIDYKIFTG